MKILHAFVYKFRFIIAILFLIISFVILVPYAKTTCRDGFYSSAIGKQGACSYHGGVNRPSFHFCYPILIFCTTLFLIRLSYREAFGFIVSARLPNHPLENEYASIKIESLPNIPNLSAESRVDWTCQKCIKNFQTGEVYFYYEEKLGKYPIKIKFCNFCKERIIDENIKMITQRKTCDERKEILKVEIYNYYSIHRLD